MQAFSIAGDDEQRVVDADAEADHRGQLRREVGHRLHTAEQHRQCDAGAESEQRGSDRQAHRHDRTERDDQDDDRREDAQRLTGGQLELGEHLPTELDAQPLDVDAVLEILDVVAERDHVLVVPVADVHLGECDRRDLADLLGPFGRVRALHLDAGVERLHVGEEVLHRGLDVGIVDSLVGLEHDLPGEPGLGGVRGLEEVLHFLGLAVGQRLVGTPVGRR